jgi:phosphoglycolate phosphatase
MVGDSSNDSLCARAAGCPVVLVAYGYSEGVPVQAIDCDGIVDSLSELPRLVTRASDDSDPMARAVRFPPPRWRR